MKNTIRAIVLDAPGAPQELLDAVAAGNAVLPIDRVHGFGQLVEAPAAVESRAAAGELVLDDRSAPPAERAS
jgi:hypothetical protein